MPKFTKKAPPNNPADKSAGNEENPSKASDGALGLTLGGNKPSSGKGYGPQGRAHVSRESGGDPTFVIAPELKSLAPGTVPAEASVKPNADPYELPVRRNVGLPGANQSPEIKND
jgi:hypothetical protein